eukprot:scaffold20264_cov65-Phaeocystis_antarctica.AAC.2
MGQTGRASSNPIKKSSHRVWERSGQGVTMLCAWTMDSCMDFPDSEIDAGCAGQSRLRANHERLARVNPGPLPGNGGKLETSLSRVTRNLAR